MGLDPITMGLGISAASGIYGAIQGNKSQKQAQNTSQQNFDFQRQAYQDAQGQLNQRNQMLQGLILPMLNGSSFNTGQDGMMQQMRGTPDGRPELGGYLDAMRKLSNQDLGDQLGQFRGSVGSLGQRFGTSAMNTEARLRERATVGLGATYAQAGLQDRSLGLQQQSLEQNKMLGLLGLLSGGPVNAGVGAPQQQFVPQQGGGFGEALGNIGNMVMLYPFLRQTMGGGGAPGSTPPFVPQYPQLGGGGIPSTLFGGMRL